MIVDDWPDAPVLLTARLSLEPQRVCRAEEMAQVLADPELYVFVGGRPLTAAELRTRYRGLAVGTVQATVTVDDDHVVAQLAWMVGVEHQRRGYAREAATAVTASLREQGSTVLIADIHPQHTASIEVARALGLGATHQMIGDEVRWTGS